MKYTATTSSRKYNFMIIKKSLVLSYMLMPFTILSQECSEINKKKVRCQYKENNTNNI